MKNWEKQIRDFHKRHYASRGMPLVLNKGCSNLGVVKAAFGKDVPEELQDLYKNIDGFGVNLPTGKRIWIIVPSHMLAQFVSNVRGWFDDTHPEVAANFCPFFDWGSGDSIGYLSNNNTLNNRLFEFSHENLEFSVGQDWKSFLILTQYRSIADLLKI